MDKATPAAMKEMIRVIQFLIDTKAYGLKLQPVLNTNDNEWYLQIYTDSDWAGDPVSRKSITGFSIFLQGAPIMWRSQAQKTVSLSSTEAEYYATSEAAKEIKFIVQVMESLGLHVRKPKIVHINNVGAIFIAETPSATKHTRHIDARYHFVREYITDGEIKIIFVGSKDNKADIFTKNVNCEVYEEHMDDYLIHHEVIHTTSPDLEKFAFFDSGGVSGMTVSVLVESQNGINKQDLTLSPSQSANRDSSMPTTFIKKEDNLIKYLEGEYTPKYYYRHQLYNDSNLNRKGNRKGSDQISQVPKSWKEDSWDIKTGLQPVKKED
jgi:hypothetical protein